MKSTPHMNCKKLPVVSISGTVNRVMLLFIAILLGVIVSFSTAEAGVKVEKSPYNKSAQKKKSHSYSCKVLMQKKGNSSNTIVKTNTRRPKWR